MEALHDGPVAERRAPVRTRRSSGLTAVPPGWDPPVLVAPDDHTGPDMPEVDVDHRRRLHALAAEVGEAFRTIAVVEDHTLVADALVDAMASLGLSAWAVPVTTRDALLADLATHRPDAVILDLTLGRDVGDAVTLIPALRRLGTRVLVATGDARRMTAARCYEAGACTVVMKGEPFEHLLEQLAAASVCERCITDNEYFSLVSELRKNREAIEVKRAPFARLTPREADVLERMCEGRSIAETAEVEFVSDTTIRSHIRSIFLKLEVRTQLAAAAAAYEAGWLEERRSRRSSRRRATPGG